MLLLNFSDIAIKGEFLKVYFEIAIKKYKDSF